MGDASGVINTERKRLIVAVLYELHEIYMSNVLEHGGDRFMKTDRGRYEQVAQAHVARLLFELTFDDGTVSFAILGDSV